MAANSLALQVGVAPACRALGVPRATFYRRHRMVPGRQQPRPTPARALCEAERERVLDTLGCERFVDRSPAEVVATLLDEGQYLCSERTMYRILAANQPVRERRNQLTHPNYTKPELVATGPNQTWSWEHHAPAGAETVDVLLPAPIKIREFIFTHTSGCVPRHTVLWSYPDSVDRLWLSPPALG